MRTEPTALASESPTLPGFLLAAYILFVFLLSQLLIRIPGTDDLLFILSAPVIFVAIRYRHRVYLILYAVNLVAWAWILAQIGIPEEFPLETLVLMATSVLIMAEIVYRLANQQVRVKQAHLETQLQFRSLVESLTDGLIMTDFEGKITYANPAAERLTGYDHQQLPGHRLTELIPDHQAKAPIISAETEILRKDGSRFMAELTVVPVANNGQALIGSLNTIRDITERKKSELVLRESGKRYQQIFENAAIKWVVNPEDLSIVEVNQAACNFYGYTREEFKHLKLTDISLLTASEIAENVKEIFEQGGALFQFRQRLKSGAIRDVEVCSSYVDIDGRRLLFSIINDITDIIQARQRQQYHAKIDQVQQNIVALLLKADTLAEVETRVLAAVGETLQVSTVCLLVLDPHAKFYVWPTSSHFQADLRLFEAIKLHLERHQMLALEKVQDFPDDLKPLLEAEAVLVSPLYLEGQIRGFVAVQDSTQRHWLVEEIATVRIIAENAARLIERKAVQQALILARDTAINTARMKSEFISNMSHEIRTPMIAVLGMLDLLREAGLGAEQREFVDIAYNSAHNLLEILDDMLDFGKIEAGKIVLESQSMDLREILLDIRASLTAQFTSKKLSFNVEVDNTVPLRVFGDPLRIRQVLLNLASNAVKFTHQGGITLRLLRVDNQPFGNALLCFSVSDTGIGIPPDQMNKIFDSFVQADGSVTRKYGGSGLGLTISRQLVEIMGGTIEVESTVGLGSTFSFTLSLPIDNARPDRGQEFAGRHVLVVDEDDAARYLLANQLRDLHVGVTELSDSRQVIPILLRALVRAEPFDLLFVRSPQEKLAVALKAELGEAAPPIVLVSEQSVSPDSNHFDATLHWPIYEAALHRLMRRLIAPVLGRQLNDTAPLSPPDNHASNDKGDSVSPTN